MLKLSSIFKEWEKAIKRRGVTDRFVPDGIIDENQYQNIVWVLRETNDYEKGNLAELINDCIENPQAHKKYWKTPSTHYKMALAVAGLLYPEKKIDDLKTLKRSALKHAAIVNMKKTKGGRNSNIDEIIKFLDEDKAFVKQEIEALKPKVVIVGGMKTVNRIRATMIKLFDLKQKEKDVYYSKSLNAIILATYHPAYTAIKYEVWIDFFQKVSKKYLQEL